MGQSDIPSACLECGSEDVESVGDKSEKSQFICSDCGLVIDKRTSSKLDTDVDWRENYGSKSSNQFARADWREQSRPAIVGLIREPSRTHHEYYRIENPRKFFEECAGEQDELKKIRESDLEPFETLDLPHIEWRYSTH